MQLYYSSPSIKKRLHSYFDLYHLILSSSQKFPPCALVYFEKRHNFNQTSFAPLDDASWRSVLPAVLLRWDAREKQMVKIEAAEALMTSVK